MQISWMVENKRRNHYNNMHDIASPNIDALSTKLRHNMLKEEGQNYPSLAMMASIAEVEGLLADNILRFP